MRKGLMSLAFGTALLAASPAMAATVLLVAGGGGGADALNGGNGQSGTTAGSNVYGGNGGTNGSGGGGSGGAGGGGVSGAGGSGSHGAGGMSAPTYAGGAGDIGGNGGYGGGGSGSANMIRENAAGGGGGGGGYSGGGGAAYGNGGGGGGSYLDASLTALPGLTVNPGNSNPFGAGANGFITITYLPVGAASVVTRFDYTGALQTYTFGSTGRYDIVAAGGQGGNSKNFIGGMGAVIGGDGYFTAGTMLNLFVGGGGGSGNYSYGYGSGGAGGGGGSFVFLEATPTAAVPEPATWAMMIAGFGLIGGALRRRRAAVTFG